MPEATEKITVNLSVVDLGRIDILVEQGFYANRTDFVKASVRRNLDLHEADITRTVDRLATTEASPKPTVRTSTSIGVFYLTRPELEADQRAGRKLRLVCVGSLTFAADIPAALVDEVVESVRVFGVLSAAPEVRAVLDRKTGRPV